MQKMPPDCTQERVFETKTHPKCQKISACGGHIIIEIRLVMLLKCNFSAPAAGKNHSEISTVHFIVHFLLILGHISIPTYLQKFYVLPQQIQFHQEY